MLPKIPFIIIAVWCFAFNTTCAQDDTWAQPSITDEMTIDPDQNYQWRMGQSPFSAKPKNAWELGINLGHFHINGDVPSDLPSGFGIGLHIRKAINYVFSWRVEGFYSNTRGLDGRLSSNSVLNLDNDDTNLSTNTYRNFKTTSFSGGFSVITNIGNLLFHSPRNKWNFYVGLGALVTSAKVEMDYLNGNSEYNWSSIESAHNENTRQKRKDIRDALDGEYDHVAENERNVAAFLHDNGNVFPSFVATIGVSRKINKRINLSLEHQVMVMDYDKFDGHEYRSIYDQTNDSDGAGFTSLRLSFNLGNFDNVTEPLYWLNPLDATYYDIAGIKQRPVLDLADADGDGVIDMLDMELDSPNGCPVDTRGVALDSDSDGIIDCKDKEPFTPPGFDVNSMGVAQIPDPGHMTENDVSSILEGRSITINATAESFDHIYKSLKKIDLPPEEYSDRTTIEINQLKVDEIRTLSTYGDIDKILTDKLNKAGYLDERDDPLYYYFQIQENGDFRGLAIVTQMEQIDENGKPVADRFNLAVGKRKPRSWWEHIILPLNTGYFRFFAFLITVEYTGGEDDKVYPLVEREQRNRRGEKELPTGLSEGGLLKGTKEITILVYEYEKRENNDDGKLTDLGLTVEDHLKEAGIKLKE